MEFSPSNAIFGAGLVGYMLSIGLNARIARIFHARQVRLFVLFFGFEALKTVILIPLVWEGHSTAYQWVLWGLRPIENALLLMIAADRLGIRQKWAIVLGVLLIWSGWACLAVHTFRSADILLYTDHTVRILFTAAMLWLVIWRSDRIAGGFVIAYVFDLATATLPIMTQGHALRMVPVFSWLAAQAVWSSACRPQPGAQSS